MVISISVFDAGLMGPASRLSLCFQLRFVIFAVFSFQIPVASTVEETLAPDSTPVAVPSILKVTSPFSLERTFPVIVCSESPSKLQIACTVASFNFQASLGKGPLSGIKFAMDKVSKCSPVSSNSSLVSGPFGLYTKIEFSGF